MWCMYMNAVYFTWSLFSKPNYKLSLYWQSMVVPFSVIVSSYFWILKIFFPDLLSIPEIRKYFPDLITHVTHTTPMITVITEVVFIRHFSILKKDVLKWNLYSFGSYLLWSLTCFKLLNKWAYPIMGVLWNSYYRCKFFGFSIVTIIIAHLISLTVGNMNKFLNKKLKRN